MRLRRSSALLRDSSEMNAEGAQEKNKWNDVELCGIMRNETIDDCGTTGHRLGGPGVFWPSCRPEGRKHWGFVMLKPYC